MAEFYQNPDASCLQSLCTWSELWLLDYSLPLTSSTCSPAVSQLLIITYAGSLFWPSASRFILGSRQPTSCPAFGTCLSSSCRQSVCLWGTPQGGSARAWRRLQVLTRERASSRLHAPGGSEPAVAEVCPGHFCTRVSVPSAQPGLCCSPSQHPGNVQGRHLDSSVGSRWWKSDRFCSCGKSDGNLSSKCYVASWPVFAVLWCGRQMHGSTHSPSISSCPPSPGQD